MAKQIFNLIFILGCLACVSCMTKTDRTGDMSQKSNLQFDNSLSQCIAIKDYSAQKIGNTTLLTLQYEHNQSIANCGCKSALSQYTVNTPHQELASGLISFLASDSRQLSVTLSNTPSLLSEQPMTVSFTCSQPL